MDAAARQGLCAFWKLETVHAQHLAAAEMAVRKVLEAENQATF
jgi:hypothetical protein